MAHEKVAAKLQSARDSVIDQWQAIVLRLVPEAKKHDRLALVDSLPEFLDNLSGTLAEGEPSERRKATRSIGTDHGLQRFEMAGFSLKQVVAEYMILRQILFETLITELVTDTDAIFIVNRAVDRALANACDRFADAERLHDKHEGERFVAAVSHDLKNPLAAARMAASVLTSGSLSVAEAENYGRMLARNLDQAELLLYDLLDVTFVRSGRKLPITPDYMNLVTLIRECIANFGPSQGLRFVLDASPEVRGYWCAHNLRRLLTNLLGNALKYGQAESPVEVTVRQDATSMILSVHNFGHPIAPEAQATLFEPFVRSESTGGTTQGWGLGLAIVRAVAEAHGGEVGVSSTPEQGTTFTVTLPNDARPSQEAGRGS